MPHQSKYDLQMMQQQQEISLTSETGGITSLPLAQISDTILMHQKPGKLSKRANLKKQKQYLEELVWLTQQKESDIYLGAALGTCNFVEVTSKTRCLHGFVKLNTFPPMLPLSGHMYLTRTIPEIEDLLKPL